MFLRPLKEISLATLELMASLIELKQFKHVAKKKTVVTGGAIPAPKT